MLSEHFLSWREQVTFLWDDDDVHFVIIDQLALLDIYSASHWNYVPQIDIHSTWAHYPNY
jgi:hypothetical protein